MVSCFDMQAGSAGPSPFHNRQQDQLGQGLGVPPPPPQAPFAIHGGGGVCVKMLVQNPCCCHAL